MAMASETASDNTNKGALYGALEANDKHTVNQHKHQKHTTHIESDTQ